MHKQGKKYTYVSINYNKGFLSIQRTLGSEPTRSRELHYMPIKKAIRHIQRHTAKMTNVYCNQTHNYQNNNPLINNITPRDGETKEHYVKRTSELKDFVRKGLALIERYKEGKQDAPPEEAAEIQEQISDQYAQIKSMIIESGLEDTLEGTFGGDIKSFVEVYFPQIGLTFVQKKAEAYQANGVKENIKKGKSSVKNTQRTTREDVSSFFDDMNNVRLNILRGHIESPRRFE